MSSQPGSAKELLIRLEYLIHKSLIVDACELLGEFCSAGVREHRSKNIFSAFFEE